MKQNVPHEPNKTRHYIFIKRREVEDTIQFRIRFNDFVMELRGITAVRIPRTKDAESAGICGCPWNSNLKYISTLMHFNDPFAGTIMSGSCGAHDRTNPLSQFCF